jgi:hypothetical protein
MAARGTRTLSSSPTTSLWLTGPSSAHVDRLRELAGLGVDQFAVYLMHDQPEATMAAYGAGIIPVPS